MIGQDRVRLSTCLSYWFKIERLRDIFNVFNSYKQRNRISLPLYINICIVLIGDLYSASIGLTAHLSWFIQEMIIELNRDWKGH